MNIYNFLVSDRCWTYVILLYFNAETQDIYNGNVHIFISYLIMQAITTISYHVFLIFLLLIEFNFFPVYKMLSFFYQINSKCIILRKSQF